MDIAERIKLLMDESRIKQKDLAKGMCLKEATLSRYVNGVRIPKAETLCHIADYFDVSVDWLLGRSEHRNYNGFISGDDALEYCRRAKKASLNCYNKTLAFDCESMSSTQLANNIVAMAHFERQMCIWDNDIPHMIHSLADGTWEEDFN